MKRNFFNQTYSNLDTYFNLRQNSFVFCTTEYNCKLKRRTSIMHWNKIVFGFLILVSLVQAKINLLEAMQTLSHPESIFKWSKPWTAALQYIHHFTNSTIELPTLKSGSPSRSHFLTVKSIQDLTPFCKQIAEKLPKEIYRRFLDYVSPVKLKRYSKCVENYEYRSFDGSCNNLRYPNWGKANGSMVRLLAPRYAGPGGIVVTKSVTTADLPLPREISTAIFPYADLPSKDYSLVVMQWGQIIAHDIGRSPSSIPVPLDCCAKVTVPVAQCLPIQIPDDDRFYSTYEQTCINMVRTLAYTDSKEIPFQVSAVSHILDLSSMYGSDSILAASLRQFEDGLMQISSTDDGRQFLPESKQPEADCNIPAGGVCFRAGDNRVNQNTQLTCLQIVLLREHNRLAKELKALNSHWNDEELYQKTRELLIAQYQHITYKEWLPIVLGKEYVIRHNLLPLKSGYTKYKPNVNPSTINSFMTAAYRVFHTTIQGKIHAVDDKECPYKALNISDWMNRPGIILEESNYDDFLRGLTAEPMQYVNRFVTKQMTEMLFHGDFPYGEDLISFDIQRGRDHGIPTYNDMRELCRRPRANNFDDLINDLGHKNVNLLSASYDDVDDVDFFVGGTLEMRVHGASVGPTFQCIIGEQFVRKKEGDRFWFEVGGSSHSFTKAQLQEIRKSSLSRLICDNADNIDRIQPNSFRFSTQIGNALVACSTLPSLDLTKWKEF